MMGNGDESWIERAKRAAIIEPGQQEYREDQRGDAWEPSAEPMAVVDKPKSVEIGGYRFNGLSSPEFFQTDYRPNWLVKRILVQKQPCIIGGPRKSLKTCVIEDLCISLASGTRFLGEFHVAEPVHVALLSGESGEFTIQETAKRICASRGLNPAELPITWEFRLPQLANPDHLQTLAIGLKQCGARVAVVDPLYLCLLAGLSGHEVDAANLFQMGPLMMSVAHACLSIGVTPVLVHHTRKNLTDPYQPLELENLAFAGIQEFARQWLLVSRRVPYEPGSGLHYLWVVAGGSVGHGGCWGVDVDEGKLADDFTGRKWEVTVSSAAETRESVAEQGDTRQREQRDAKDKAEDAKVLSALDQLDPDRNGTSYTKVRSIARLGTTTMQRAIVRLVAARLIEEIDLEVKIGSKSTRRVQGLRRVPLMEQFRTIGTIGTEGEN